MSKKFGVQATGIVLPLMKKGDDLINTVVDCVLPPFKEEHWYWKHEELSKPYVTYEGLNDKDIIGITESLVGRCYGLYVTVDEIAENIETKFGKDATICLVNPIYSRNRFSKILKGIARAAKKIIITMPEIDEVGNPKGVNPFTGVNIEEYYKKICENENCKCEISRAVQHVSPHYCRNNYIICNLHNNTIDGSIAKTKQAIRSEVLNNIEGPCTSYDYECADHKVNDSKIFTLTDICSDKNPDFGLLGSNKANDENGGTLKLFPTRELAAKVCNEVKTKIKEKTGKDIYVMVYGDGHFHSPYLYDEDGNEIPGTSINEFADPVAFLSGADTHVFNDTPNEFKLKYFIDSGVPEEKIREQMEDTVMKNTSNLGQMSAQGCTPRRYGDLLATLCDQISGSGSRATPVVLVQNYF